MGFSYRYGSGSQRCIVWQKFVGFFQFAITKSSVRCHGPLWIWSHLEKILGLVLAGRYWQLQANQPIRSKFSWNLQKFQRCVHRGQFCCRMKEFSQAWRVCFSTALSSAMKSSAMMSSAMMSSATMSSATMSSATMSSFLGWKRHESSKSFGTCVAWKREKLVNFSSKTYGASGSLISTILRTFFGAIFLSNCPKNSKSKSGVIKQVTSPKFYRGRDTEQASRSMRQFDYGKFVSFDSSVSGFSSWFWKTLIFPWKWRDMRGRWGVRPVINGGGKSKRRWWVKCPPPKVGGGIKSFRAADRSTWGHEIHLMMRFEVAPQNLNATESFGLLDWMSEKCPIFHEILGCILVKFQQVFERSDCNR